MIAFEVSDFKTTVVQAPAQAFADRIAEFSRAKSREVEELRKERDAEREAKLKSMEEIVRMVK